MYLLPLLLCLVLCTGYFITVSAQAANNVIPCITPDKERTHCISLFSCPGLMKSLATLEPSAIKYFKLSICVGCKSGSFMVCCGKSNLLLPTDKVAGDPSDSPVSPKSPPPNETKREKVLRTLIPDRRYCGLQHTDDRFYNSPATALDEFPWLVHVKFTDIHTDYKLGDRCTGVLLNPKYVLTDTVCAKPALKVRLGQYNVAYKMTCLENPHAQECNEGTVEIRVEKKINLQPKNDESYSLSLIRLSKSVDYSDFIRPICLPLREHHRPGNDETLTFSGWGANPQRIVRDDAIKKRMTYDMAKMEECTKINPFLQSFIDKNSIPLNCFYPQKKNNDSACPGDHGGPLMYSDTKHQFYVEYVVVEVGASNFGLCSSIFPAVAMKITSEIIDTILDSIEP